MPFAFDKERLIEEFNKSGCAPWVSAQIKNEQSTFDTEEECREKVADLVYATEKDALTMMDFLEREANSVTKFEDSPLHRKYLKSLEERRKTIAEYVAGFESRNYVFRVE